MAKERVLITGASGGIGLELARCFGGAGHPLVLVARDEPRLQAVAKELRERHQVEVSVVALDLAGQRAGTQLLERLRQEGHLPQILVNNAGFGHFGEFHSIPVERDLGMIQLNIAALTELTKGVLPEMLKARSGRILQVASTAAFQPGPFMAVYYATKAYVLSLSEALHEELRGTGVTVTTLCPGPTATGFQSAAKLEGSRLFKSLAVATPESVARAGFSGTIAGKRLVIPGWMNRASVLFASLAPRALVLRAVKFIQRKSGP